MIIILYEKMYILIFLMSDIKENQMFPILSQLEMSKLFIFAKKK